MSMYKMQLRYWKYNVISASVLLYICMAFAKTEYVEYIQQKHAIVNVRINLNTWNMSAFNWMNFIIDA